MKTPRRLPGIITFLAALGTAFGAATATDYAGDWVLKLGTRNLLVLSLRADSGVLTGSLTRAAHMKSSDGTTFSTISPEVVTLEVTKAAVREGTLFLTVRNPDASGDEEFEVTLTGKDGASFKPAGFPFSGWPVVRAVAGSAKVATDWEANRTYSVGEGLPAKQDNAEMRRIYEEDQAPRTNRSPTQAEWVEIQKQDTIRREATLKLLSDNQLQTGKDFEYAAFIFQHSTSPNDYLLAHTLAIVSVAKGNAAGAWIAAATLDRYLQTIGKPQIYGTQFLRKSPTAPTTQEPYSRDLIPDALRHVLGVPALAQQQKQLDKMNTPPAKP